MSLSDREKFHTGILSFVINNLEGKAQLNLLKSLWGEKAVEKLEGHQFSSEVEQKSVDLVVRSEPSDPKNSEIVLWAEVKFKTTLSEKQIEKYQEKLPAKAHGALFALFTGVDKAPKGFREVTFQTAVLDPTLDILANLKCSGDAKAMIRLWIAYLKSMNVLTKHMMDRKLKKIEVPNFEKELKALKINGIFGHYRHSLFLNKLENRLENLDHLNALKKPDICRIQQFNSNGNSAIEFRIRPFPELNPINWDTKPDPSNWDCHMGYGLQWQSGALKLFIDVAPVKFYSSTAKIKFNALKEESQYRELRGQNLKILFEKIPTLQPKRPLTNANPLEKKFFSYTIHKWDLYSSIEDNISVFFSYLNYLISAESKKIVRQGTVLSGQRLDEAVL